MNWNREKLIDKYMEDPDAVKSAAGISDREPRFTVPTAVAVAATSSAPATRSSSKQKKVQEPWMCPICCCDPEPPTGVMALGCDHMFCTDCWSTYLTGKIREEGEHSIRCMESGCNQLVPDTVIVGTTHSELVIDEETRTKFKELLVRFYVQCTNALRFCPAPGCDYTVQCKEASSRASLDTIVPSVKCSNGHDFCFGCGEESDHRPLICSIAKLWLKKCQDDSETANWIKSNTKECPKCHSTIEKNGGCK